MILTLAYIQLTSRALDMHFYKIYLWIIGEEKVFVDSIDDIFNYQETILKAVEQFI